MKHIPMLDLKREYLYMKEDVDSAIAAAQAWMRYLSGRKLNLKEHFLSDFYIGGFASAKCSAILTRDRGIYTKYFPRLVGYEDCLKNKAF